MNRASIEKEFDEKWWYDSVNLRLCSKDVEVRDEDDNLVGYSQHAAAVPADIKSFLFEKIAEVLEEVLENHIPKPELTDTYMKKVLGAHDAIKALAASYKQPQP